MASLDDYRAMMSRYYAANPLQYANEAAATPEELMSGSSDRAASTYRYEDELAKQHEGFLNTLSPAQQAELRQLSDDRNSKNLAQTKLISALFAAGVGGAGMGLFGNMGAGLSGAEGLMGAGGWDAATSAAWGSAAGGDLGMAGWMGTGAGEMGLEAGVAGLASSGAGGASPWGSFLKTLTSPVGNMATKAGGSLLSQLIAGGGNAYMGNKQAGQYDDVISQINQLFAPDSPYAKQMQQSLARKDAAAGRNSQYGDRSVQLAAALTQAKSNALTSPGYGNLMAQRGTNQNSTINGFLAALGSGPGQDLITKAGSGIGNYFKNFFGSEGEKYSPSTPNAGFDNDWMAAYAPD